MAKLKSERHHWWPEGVSQFWKDEDGFVTRTSSDGNKAKAPPKNFGVIGNAHHIKFGVRGNEGTFFDESFEGEFQKADDNFPSVIEWLHSLDRPIPKTGAPLAERMTPQPADEQKLDLLIEGIVSLAVRSPKTRESAVSLAEHLRGPLEGRERNNLIGLNMRNAHRDVLKSTQKTGKFMIAYSPEREFIFGDGFFNNITAPGGFYYTPKIAVPLTPWICAIYARPHSYRAEPRIITATLIANETQIINHAVGVYSKNEVFFRSDEPPLGEEFWVGEHRQYSHPDNPIDDLIRQIPGIPPRDKSLDFLRTRFGP